MSVLPGPAPTSFSWLVTFIRMTPRPFFFAAGRASSSNCSARAGFMAICTQSRSFCSMAFAITAPSVWLVIPIARVTFWDRSS